jgi:hypothetical protein
MKRLAALLLAVPWCGCLAAQKEQATACEREATQIIAKPVSSTLEDLRGWRKEIDDHVRKCMSDHGYETRCRAITAATSPYCYLPANFLDRLITQLQVKYEQP